MQQELINGNDSYNGSNDGYAFGNFDASEKGLENDLNLFFEIMNEFKKDHLDIHHSNKRFDTFLFYYSSKL